MELKIIKKTDNPLFKRKEIKATIQANSTPSYLEVLDLVKEKYSIKDESKIKIKEIQGKFGSKEFDISISIYENPEDKNKLERKDKKDTEMEKKLAKRNAPKQEPETTESPTKEKPAENTQEENK